MSAAPSVTLDPVARRAMPRRQLSVSLDVIALRSGVPENLPGRCTDLGEGGAGAVVAGDLIPGQQVAIEFRLPHLGVPVRARALVRHQQRLRCGLQFVGLTLEQREMIRYWVRSVPAKPESIQKRQESAKTQRALAPGGAEARVRKTRLRLQRLYVLLLLTVGVGGLEWWHWERSWSELEAKTATTPAREPLRVSPEVMERQITYKPAPTYPEAARRAGTQGMVVLDAVIGSDGRIKQLNGVSGADVLVESAKAAVQSWTFEPYLFDGKPAEVETTISVEFRLR